MMASPLKKGYKKRRRDKRMGVGKIEGVRHENSEERNIRS